MITMNVFTVSEVPQGRYFINRRFQPTVTNRTDNPASKKYQSNINL
jgi:hypothetical protein